jgi:hypothetical protein
MFRTTLGGPRDRHGISTFALVFVYVASTLVERLSFGCGQPADATIARRRPR